MLCMKAFVPVRNKIFLPKQSHVHLHIHSKGEYWYAFLPLTITSISVKNWNSKSHVNLLLENWNKHLSSTKKKTNQQKQTKKKQQKNHQTFLVTFFMASSIFKDFILGEDMYRCVYGKYGWLCCHLLYLSISTQKVKVTVFSTSETAVITFLCVVNKQVFKPLDSLSWFSLSQYWKHHVLLHLWILGNFIKDAAPR